MRLAFLGVCAIFLAVAAFEAVPVAASDVTSGNIISNEDKNTTIQALKAAKKGQWSKAEQLAAGTRDPLAAKLYYWLYYTQSGKNVPFARVAAFIRQNPAWPRQEKMKLVAESAIDDSVTDEEIIYWFRDYPPITAKAMARYLRALQIQGRTPDIKAALRGWWKDADLSPEQQKTFLQQYKAYISPETNVARMDSLLFKQQYTNARAIALVLGHGYPQLAQARIALSEDKGGVDHSVAAVPPHLQDDPGLMFERLRWRRRHGKDIAAMEILHSPPPAEKINNPAQWWEERQSIARRLMEKKQYDSAYSLVAKHQQKQGPSFAHAEFLAGWLALRFLEQPWKAFEHFEALYHGTKTPVSRARAAYWAGRASDRLGYKDIAIQWYQSAARHQTTFYGQLAIGALDTQYRPPQQLPPQRTVQAELAFNEKEMVQAARILNQAGYRKETTMFLDALADSVKTPEDYLLVADLSEDLDHFSSAIRISKKGLEKNIFLMDHAYPTLLSRMRRVDLEWALVHALIRQESAFDYDAQSHAGARGLMQLMPATAQETAKKQGLPYNIARLTDDPDYNIRLGTAYMQSMINRYDGSYALALAAYNGGPGRVDRWLREFGDPRKGEIEMIDWIELVPIYETRNYVQRVLEGVYIYRLKLKGVQKNASAPIHVASTGAK